MKFKYKILIDQFIVGLMTCLLCLPLAATDEEAQIEIEKAQAAFDKEEFRDAGDYYQAAKLYADTPKIKKNCLIKAGEAYGKANQKYKQFESLRDLVIGFSDQIPFEEVVHKEYEIGNDFAQGHRDITLSWMPWIKGKNKSVEIYETVLKQAPFAKFAPALKLRLGRMYLADDKVQKALNIFRQIMKEHPNAPEDKFARFELANALVQMATKAGDGDGMYAREAEEVLLQALEKYPKDPETKWIKQSIYDTDEVRAKRLCDIGEFYVSRKNPEAATRYFHELLARYPTSEYAETAKKNLVTLDEEYTPSPTPKKELIRYPIDPLDPEPKVILIAPQASGGKWMLPIEDLDLDGKNAEMEYQAKISAEREAKEKARKERAKRVAAELAKRKKKAAERKQKAEADAKKKAEEAKQKAEEQKRAEEAKKAEEEEIKTEKQAIDQEKAEKLEKELKAQAEAERKAQAKKKQEEEKAKKEAAAKKAKQKKAGKPEEITDFKVTAKGEESKGTNYILPLIILLLIIIAGIVYYVKKKQNSGA